MAHDLHLVRAKDNLNLSHGRRSQSKHQAPTSERFTSGLLFKAMQDKYLASRGIDNIFANKELLNDLGIVPLSNSVLCKFKQYC